MADFQHNTGIFDTWPAPYKVEFAPYKVEFAPYKVEFAPYKVEFYRVIPCVSCVARCILYIFRPSRYNILCAAHV